MEKNDRANFSGGFTNSSFLSDEYKMESINSVDTKPKTQNLNGRPTGYLLFCISVSVIGAAFQVGWNIGVYNTPIDVIKDFFNQTNFDRNKEYMSQSRFDLLWSVTNGLLPLGAAFGGISSGLIADKFGRKNGMILTNIFVIICGVLNLISKFVKAYETLIVARFFSGLFCGLFTGILPLYLTELPPQNLRGSAGTLNQLLIVLGILITNIMGLRDILGSEDRWPILVTIMLAPALAHIGLFFAAESPKYLYIKKNNPELARETLKRLRGYNENLVNAEMKMLQDEKIAMDSQKEVSWGDLFTVPSLRHPLIIAVCIHIAQQFSGINAVIFYSTNIFKSVGLKDQWPLYATILLGVVQLVMTLVCTVIIEKAGRKILLLIGMGGMCLSSFGIGLTRIFSGEAEWLNYLTVVFSVFYIIFFSIGPGAIPWIMTSELFKSNARAKANSIAVFVNWTSAFIVTVSFQFIEAAIGDYSFILFGGLLVFFTLFMLFFVPETKNRTVEEITEAFAYQTLFLFNNSKKKEMTVRF
ncbi:unnamed protein product [Brachionus calyciflorus]|uniref:Major facilitator superfamily (MFS) profile domain-containing protein n=1 Tax=Brachionus calyciflorus TaxID=104777 RepID=A0A813NH22_9BILA|nr:unnamed protein product [Brachionus calyciflorus]